MLRSIAVMNLLFLISSASAFAGSQHGFSIHVFTSPAFNRVRSSNFLYPSPTIAV
jgi:hypothetical protein